MKISIAIDALLGAVPFASIEDRREYLHTIQIFVPTDRPGEPPQGVSLAATNGHVMVQFLNVSDDAEGALHTAGGKLVILTKHLKGIKAVRGLTHATITTDGDRFTLEYGDAKIEADLFTDTVPDIERHIDAGFNGHNFGHDEAVEKIGVNGAYVHQFAKLANNYGLDLGFTGIANPVRVKPIYGPKGKTEWRGLLMPIRWGN